MVKTKRLRKKRTKRIKKGGMHRMTYINVNKHHRDPAIITIPAPGTVSNTRVHRTIDPERRRNVVWSARRRANGIPIAIPINSSSHDAIPAEIDPIPLATPRERTPEKTVWF